MDEKDDDDDDDDDDDVMRLTKNSFNGSNL